MNPIRRSHPEATYHEEARELRRIIREQRAEIKRLRAALDEVANIALQQTDQDHASNDDSNQ